MTSLLLGLLLATSGASHRARPPAASAKASSDRPLAPPPASPSPAPLEMPPPPVLRTAPPTPPPSEASPSSPALRPMRVAIFDLAVRGDVPARPLAVLQGSLAPEIRKLEAVSALSAGEIRDMLSLERQKSVLGCSDDSASCLMEVAGAVDADELVTSELTLVGGTYTLQARRMNMRSAKVVQSWSRSFPKRDGEELLAMVGPLVEGLYPERPPKAGKVRGIEPAVVRRLNPPPLPRWVFFATSGVAVAGAAVGAGFGYLSSDASRDFHAALDRSAQTAVPGAEVLDLQARARERAQLANLCFAGAGVVALAAGVEALFTDWHDDRAALTVTPSLSAGGAGVAVGARF